MHKCFLMLALADWLLTASMIPVRCKHTRVICEEEWPEANNRISRFFRTLHTVLHSGAQRGH